MKRDFEVWFNPLYSDGMSRTDTYNKDGIVHFIFQGIRGRNVQIIMYCSS